MRLLRRANVQPWSIFLALAFTCGLSIFAAPRCATAEPSPQAVAAFNSYIAAVESRLAQQHRSQNEFLSISASAPQNAMPLRRGEFVIERLTPANGPGLLGALLHHWRGTAFVPGAKAADFERLMKDIGSYPRRFAPQVLEAKALSKQGDRMQISMRVRQRHVLTVVLVTSYDVVYGRLDAQHGYSLSRSTQIAEIASPGTAAEHALTPGQEHGFLWRQNIYWSYEERDGGLYLQVESVSLTRSIPTGLGWAVSPFVESVPRESLEFTLRATCGALRNNS
jgi:hypothetical protein